MHAFGCMHAFDCIHAYCLPGAVYIVDGSNSSFGGETVFANNTAKIGGKTVTCTGLNESQMTVDETSSRKGMFWYINNKAKRADNLSPSAAGCVCSSHTMPPPPLPV